MNLPFANSFEFPSLSQTPKLSQIGLQVLLGFLFAVLIALPGKAAEKVYFSYGLLERSVSVFYECRKDKELDNHMND